MIVRLDSGGGNSGVGFSGRRLLQPLDNNTLTFVAGDPVFVPLTADALASGFSLDDGFDSDLMNVVGAMEGDTNADASLDQHLADAEFIDGAIEGATITPATADFDAAATAGDAQLDDAARVLLG